MSGYVGEPETADRFTIRDVVVVDPAEGRASAGMDVHVEGGVVSLIESTGRPGSLRNADVVEGGGRWVVPGLVDMHAHPLNTPDDIDGAYALMMANGVVGYRQMSGNRGLLTARRAGTLPRSNGAPALLALPGDLLTPMNASTPEGASATVREQHGQGADFVKAALIGREALFAALAEGRRLGIPVAGHLPSDADPRDAAAAGMHSIEHLGPGASVFAATSSREAAVRAATASTRKMPNLPRVKLPGMERVVGKLIGGIVVNPATRTSTGDAEGLRLADATFDEGAAQALAEVFIEHGTWHCPTLIRLHTEQFPTAPEHAADPRRTYMAADELRRWDKSARKFDTLPAATRDVLELHWETQLRLTRIFADAGVPMLAGTDANGATGVIPGFALHDEFDLLAAAGLEPLTILRMATSAPAQFLGRADRAGRIAVGYDADLVLLDEDPLTDHRAVQTITGVVRGGSYWGRALLDETLLAVESGPGAR